MNLSSTEPRKYIKRDRPRSIAATDSKHIVSLNHTSSSAPGLTDLSGIISPEKVEKKVKIQTPIKDRKNNATNSQNGEEWTEISLNNSPDEVYYNNDIYSDEEDQIPYKPLPMDLSPELAQAINVIAEPSKEQTNRKRLVTQKSLPTMSKVNEVTLSEEKKAEVTRSPSVKNRSKLDSSLANWITRSSAGGEISGGSSSM